MDFQKGVLVVALATGLVGCGEDGELFGSTKEGNVQIALTDAPVESAAKVVVTFDEIEFLREGDETLSFSLRRTSSGCEAVEEKDRDNDDEPCSLDLLTLTNGRSLVLLNEDIKTGRYSQIRLGVEAGNNTYLELEDGSQYPFNIPSAAQTGLKLVREFRVDEDSPIAFTIDFDVRKSMVRQGNNSYKLKPTLRIVETAEAARIVGTVDENALVDPLCGSQDYINGSAGVVYVFPGRNVTPDDIDPVIAAGAEPLTTTRVEYDPGTITFNFTAAFLPAGDYTLAYTCQADDPEANFDIVFSAPVNVSLDAGDTATLVLETR